MDMKSGFNLGATIASIGAVLAAVVGAAVAFVHVRK